MKPALNIIWICLDQFPQANRAAPGESSPFWSMQHSTFAVFERAYTVLPICSPARASMLTGLYPHQHGLTENDGRFGGRSGLSPTDRLIHNAFAEAGYRNALFGKWHLDNKRSATSYGFEGFSLPGYGYPYAADAYHDYLQRTGLPEPVATIELPGECGTHAGSQMNLCALQNWPEFESGSMVLQSPAETHEAFFVIDEACNWIEENTEPFFACVNPWGPHPPYCVGTPFTDTFDSGTDWRSPNFFIDLSNRPAHHQVYRDEWSELDYSDKDWRLLTRRAMQQSALVEAAVMKLVQKVDALGLSDRTVIVISADHGDAVGSNGGVANKGGLLTEETVRIPLMIRGPGIEPGIRSELATNLDIAPTLHDLAGLKQPEHFAGQSLVHSRSNREGIMLEHYGLHHRAIQRAWYHEHRKLVVQQDGFEELYDLTEDPTESCNLAGIRQHGTALQLMRKQLFDEMLRLEDPEILHFQP